MLSLQLMLTFATSLVCSLALMPLVLRFLFLGRNSLLGLFSL